MKHALSTTKAGMQYMQLKFHEEMQNLGKKKQIFAGSILVHCCCENLYL